MPLLHVRHLSPHTVLGLWQLQEPPDELLQRLPSHVATRLQVMGKMHPKRQQEWLGSRVLVYQLLQHFTEAPVLLDRDELGKPFFPGHNLFVSISHAPQLAAVILSDTHEVGIDIEQISPKALRVADRFLTEEEKGYTASEEATTCLYWSAKETLYKMYSRKQLALKENLSVKPLVGLDILQGQVHTENFSKLYQIHHETVQGHVLTYCIDSAS
ncbi:4'-phosphopantetheinyl transferase superfamily protein [Pontibacter ummariensis]|uniref:Enterobactin synthase component D n=1 Tax=Pontibacter ummariensis TaxID=1610492 RepID=A0A239BEX5_9BACT|nr:4'-phosphopantetheinyl transferase family protein [Pontibacter ummariensis]PRY16463.1 4'-phosphopantetheinyl transferase superfamily protein [Pontibacter ummariensis]SNS05603.1 4'-phosphopantetheinyl transferase superfamily protein [Pontibacter ummariensis]